MLKAFLLGLSNGGVCVAYCAPVLVPYLLGGGGGPTLLRNCGAVSRFLAGRLLGYLLFAVLAWLAGSSLLPETGSRGLFIGASYMALSVLLVLYGFSIIKVACPVGPAAALSWRRLSSLPFLVPVAAGLATGLSFCPPFLLALVGAAETRALTGGLAFFAAFFVGTSVFFIPAPFIGLVRPPVLRTVGRMAAGVMGVYYFYSGLIMLLGGMKNL